PFASETRERPPLTKRRQRGAPWEARGGVFEQYVEHGGCPPGPAQRSRHGSIARCSRRSVRNAGLGARTPVAFVRHSRPVSRRGDSSQFITFHHSRGPPPPPRIRHFDTTLRFSPAVPTARPLAAPGSSVYPIANKCNRSYSDRSGGTLTHPTEFDTFR